MNKFADKLKTDHEEEEEQHEYIEVADPRTIKAILQEELHRKTHPSPPTLKSSQPPSHKQVEHIAARKEKPQFLKDDRKRETPLHYKEKTAENGHKQAENGYKQAQGKRDNHKQTQPYRDTKLEEATSPKKYIAREQVSRRAEQHSERHNKIEHVDNKKYVQKAKQEEQYDGARKDNKKERVIYEEKKTTSEETHKTAKPKRQLYEHKGEEIELQLINDWEEFDNAIYVGKKEVQRYVEKADIMLKQFDFILLRSFGIFVDKALLVAGLLAEKTAGLKQISIPQTVEVYMISKEGEKKRSRGAITIELSLTRLDQKHIGYQETSANSHKEKVSIQKEKKVEYKQKRQPAKYQEKKPERRGGYVQKKGNRPRTISEEEQLERELR